jgi:hypothetical protein
MPPTMLARAKQIHIRYPIIMSRTCGMLISQWGKVNENGWRALLSIIVTIDAVPLLMTHVSRDNYINTVTPVQHFYEFNINYCSMT